MVVAFEGYDDDVLTMAPEDGTRASFGSAETNLWAVNLSSSVLSGDGPPPRLNVSSNSSLIDEATAMEDDHFTYLTEGVLLTIVSTFGIVGNIMSVIVLTRSSSFKTTNSGGGGGNLSGVGGGCGSSSFSNLLRGLATSDALFLIMALLAFGLPHLSARYKESLFTYIMPVCFGLLHTFRVGSVYVTLAVTFERFHAIIFPLRHFAWKKYLLPTSVAIAVCYNIPRYFELKIKVHRYK